MSAQQYRGKDTQGKHSRRKIPRDLEMGNKIVDVNPYVNQN